MRLLACAALALLLPLAGADPAPPVRQCAEVGCVVAKDTDGDGDHEWANAALAVEEQLVANANANNTTARYEVALTTEELGGHELEEVVELQVVTASVSGEANLTAEDGSPGFHEADVLAAVLLMDHETGAQEPVVWRYARAYDADGDDVPDGVETLP